MPLFVHEEVQNEHMDVLLVEDALAEPPSRIECAAAARGSTSATQEASLTTTLVAV